MAKQKPGSITIPMDKEEASTGGRLRVAEGDYVAKILGAKATNSKDKGTPGILWKGRIVGTKYDGKEFTDVLWLTPKALPRVRQFLELIGVEVPKTSFNVPIKQIKGKEIGVTFEDDSYEDKNGKTRMTSRVSWEFLDAELVGKDDVDEDEDEDEDDDEDELEDLDLEDDI
jgi:hypothetical protein